MTSASVETLRDEAAAARFYDQRFRRGYMEGWSQDKRARVFQLIKQLPLPARGRVLDFGCGTGLFTEVLQRALPGWTIEGTDLSSVAVETARRRLPNCQFFQFAECANRYGEFDLIFTHHVLEHVSDLASTASLLTALSKPTASMFHILPCGNSGSFEHHVCLMRTDGISTEPERLFFFEEEGHLRRLDTEGVVALWLPHGYRLCGEWYASQRIGAIMARTSFGLEDVLAFADPDKAVDEQSRRSLARLRMAMVALWAARKPVVVVRNKMKHGCHSARDWFLLIAGLGTYPAAAFVEWTLKRLEAHEWAKHQGSRAGNEMFLHLVRP